MAKVVIGRLPNATPEYDRTQFDTLIRELDQIITQLNFLSLIHISEPTRPY